MNKKSFSAIIRQSVSSLMAASMIFTSFSAFASSGLIVNIDTESKMLSIGGEIDAPQGSGVSVNVVSYGDSPFDDGNTPVLSRVFFVGEGGTLDYSIPVSNLEAGKYDVYVGTANSATASKTTVMLVDMDGNELKEALDKINSTTSAPQLTTVLNTYASDLGIDKDLVEDIDALSKVIYSLKNAEGAFSYTEFTRAFNVAEASYAFSKGKTFDEVMQKNAAAFGTSYSAYSSLDNDIKSALNGLVPRMNLNDGFLDFDDITLLAEVVGASNYGNMKKVLLANTEFFDIDINSEYSELSENNKTKVFMRMYEKRSDYISQSDVSESFDKISETLLDEQNERKSPADSTGGGGSGKTSGNFSTSAPSASGQNVADTSVFTDINGHWAYNEINELSKLGIINGFEDKTFRPDNTVSRAQLSKMVVEAFDIKLGGDVKSFTDVNESQWHWQYINILSSNNIVSGDGINFYPDNQVTRQDAAVILYNALSFVGKTYSGSVNFADSDLISNYAKKPVEILGANGIIKGDEQGFRPHSTLTRAEAAALIYRLINN